MKKEYKSCSKKGGVYQIKNLINEKVYIGSAKCFQVRASQHQGRLNSGKHHNKHLLASWKKYGSQNFLFEVLEVVEGGVEQRRNREQHYIDQYLDNWEMCYNLVKYTVTKRRIWSKNPEVTKRKISLAVKKAYKANPELGKKTSLRMKQNNPTKDFLVRLKISQRQTGRKLTKKQREKISLAHKGKKLTENHKRKIGDANKIASKGHRHTEATKKKISKATKGEKNPFFGKKHSKNTLLILKEKLGRKNSPLAEYKPFVVINILSGQKYKFNYKFEAVNELNLIHHHLSAVLSGKRKTHKGFKAYYV